MLHPLLWASKIILAFVIRACTDIVTLASSLFVYMFLKTSYPPAIKLLTYASDAVSSLIIRITKKFLLLFPLPIHRIIIEEIAEIFAAKAITYVIIGVFIITATDALISIVPLLLKNLVTVFNRDVLGGARQMRDKNTYS